MRLDPAGHEAPIDLQDGLTRPRQQERRARWCAPYSSSVVQPQRSQGRSGRLFQMLRERRRAARRDGRFSPHADSFREAALSEAIRETGRCGSDAAGHETMSAPIMICRAGA
jgi:hypothetical protein